MMATDQIRSIRTVDEISDGWIAPLHQADLEWTDNRGKTHRAIVQWCPWDSDMWEKALGRYTEAMLILFKRDLQKGKHSEWDTTST